MEEREDAVDLLAIVETLKENRKPIRKITIGFMIAGFLFWLIARLFFPSYESEARLQVRQSSAGGGMMAAMMANMGGVGSLLSMDSTQMGSYIEILKSRGVVIPVIEATEETDYFGKYPRYENYVEKRIMAGPLNMTDVLTVKVRAESPEKAQKVNQMLLDGFLKRVTELNSSQKGSVKSFLEERLKTAKEDLDKAETARRKFKEENKLISPSDNATIFSSQIMEIEKMAAANKVEKEAAEARLAAINQQLSGSGASSANNQTIQQYQSELAKLETTRISYKDKYTEKHPRMIAIEEQIAKLKSKIQEEVTKVAALQAPSDNMVHQGLVAGKYQSEGAVEVARQKGEALQKLIDENNAKLAELPAIEQEYIRLTRDYTVASEIYMLLTKQLEQTKITEFQGPDNILVIDPPHLPDKTAFPRGGITMILATFLGLVVSCGYVVLKELKNQTIRTPETITKFVGIPVLGGVPDITAVTQVQAEGQETRRERLLNKVREYIWKK